MESLIFSVKKWRYVSLAFRATYIRNLSYYHIIKELVEREMIKGVRSLLLSFYHRILDYYFIEVEDIIESIKVILIFLW